MNVALNQAWWLLLLPLGLLPWLVRSQSVVSVPSVALLPHDPLARWIDHLLKLFGSVAIILLLALLSHPYIPATAVIRSGEGAHTVLLVDRSRSMDEPFGSRELNASRLVSRDPGARSKSRVAAEILEQFASNRNQDRFGMTVFSTKPIRTLPITDKPEIIRAAIKTGAIGRGLAETNIGSALLGALEYYEDKPYVGTRNILLLSDGGDSLSTPVRARVRALLRKHRVSLYWIYIRDQFATAIDSDESPTPHSVLNRFFSSLETPYKLYTAENPEDLNQAVVDFNRVQTQPILYEELVPQREAGTLLYFFATLTVAGLLLCRLLLYRSP